jgi:hypothetical protein
MLRIHRRLTIAFQLCLLILICHIATTSLLASSTFLHDEESRSGIRGAGPIPSCDADKINYVLCNDRYHRCKGLSQFACTAK